MEKNNFFTDYVNTYKDEGSFHEDSGYPKSITIKPTLRCIANCRHCEGRLKQTLGEKELQLNDYEILFNDLAELGTKSVCISGGEPLLYKNLNDIVKMIRKQGMNVSLNTNGFLLKRDVVEKLIQSGVNRFNISIDSPYYDIHNNIRRLPNLLQNIEKNLKDIDDLKDKFELNIRMILSKCNYMDINEMIDLCERIGADSLSIDMIENDFKNKEFLLDEDQIRYFNNVIKPLLIKRISNMYFPVEEDRKKALQQISSMFDTSFNKVENYANGIYRPDQSVKKKCTIPSSFMIIEGDGSVLPCNAVEYTRNPIVGNILENSIKEIWMSENWEDFRINKMDFCTLCPMNMSYIINFNNKNILGK